jgi:hypothetical protein
MDIKIKPITTTITTTGRDRKGTPADHHFHASLGAPDA